jgi:pimeloyl-ACP methyl ester carboxylesterase
LANFVLVHGAWSGSSSFRHVRRLLQLQGHQVFTPSLTGLGERTHLSSPMVGLGTHIRDVVNHILYEDLDSITLLGFSYGGFVVTGALEHVADRVRHLVFLDAFVPESGDTVLAHVGRAGRAALQLGETWLVPPPERQFDDPQEGKWVAARRSPHPIGCFTEPVYLSKPLEEFAFDRTYIKATLDPVSDVGAAAFQRAADRAKSSSAWRYAEIETTHMVASNRPGELAAILLEGLAKESSGPPDPAVKARA